MTIAKWKNVRDDNSRALLSGRVKGGVQADAYIDGRARWWSWGCSQCGDYDDQLENRETARKEYAEHKKYCEGKPST